MSRFPNYTKIPFSAMDLETSIKNRGEDAIGKSKPSPHHPDNKICWFGVTVPSTYSHCGANSYYPPDWGDNEFKMLSAASDLMQVIDTGVGVLVGHNIKFDLLYLMKFPMLKIMLDDWLWYGGVVWDTMIAEYLLTGQESQFISLDNLSTRYGGHVKDERLKKEYWDKGIDTENIPREIILPYLQGDLRNTANNYLSQLDKCESLLGQQKHNFYALMSVQMEALLATTMMEHNGLHFDVPAAAEIASTLAAKREIKSDKLKETMAQWFNLSVGKGDPPVVPEDCKPGSVQQLSAMLCGGVFKYTKKMPVRDDNGDEEYYKGGMKKGLLKMRNEDLLLHVSGLIEHKAHGLIKNEKGYCLDDFALKKLLSERWVKKMTVFSNFLSEIMLWRSLQKEVTVSYLGLLKLTWPNDSCIHGNLNHTATGTGRLSSSAPNQQNFSGREVKE